MPDDNVLQYTEDDILVHDAIVYGASGIGSLECEDIVRAFSAQQINGCISKPGFDSAIRELVPGDTMSEEEKNFLSQILSSVFNAFLYGDDGKVDFAEIVSGIVTLCGGNKSAKLSTMWSLFDEDHDGRLSRHELWRFIRGFLTCLLVLTVVVLLPLCLMKNLDALAPFS